MAQHTALQSIVMDCVNEAVAEHDLTNHLIHKGAIYLCSERWELLHVLNHLVGFFSRVKDWGYGMRCTYSQGQYNLKTIKNSIKRIDARVMEDEG